MRFRVRKEFRAAAHPTEVTDFARHIACRWQVVATQGPLRDKEKLLWLGIFPDATSKAGRDRRDEARMPLADIKKTP